MPVVLPMLLASLPLLSQGHGSMTFPPSNRQNSSLEIAGDCYNGECKWFSEWVFIPGEPTLNDARLRTMNVNISSGPYDWTRRFPWRAPGSAPVFGSGCGVAGGGPAPGRWSGGNPPPGIDQGADFLTLASKAPQIWQCGGAETVAWAIRANHGGGYAYRLCKQSQDPTQVNETCFQQTPLRFARDTHRIQYQDLRVTMDSDPVWDQPIKMPSLEIPMVKVTEGTHPPGSEWARNPIPSCLFCSPKEMSECGHYEGGDVPDAVACLAVCNGGGLDVCPPGATMFEPPAFGLAAHFRGSATKVIVPHDLDTGDYLLSWRWDTEESGQVWQNCADIRIVDNIEIVAEAPSILEFSI